MFMSQMKIQVKQATIVKPAEETPMHSLWLSNLDLIQVRFHMGILYFYNPCSSSSLPNTQSLIDALSKVLVLFYPAAGRLQKDKNGRLEVRCNGEGVLLVEAETDFTIQDVGLLTQGLDLSQLAPTLPYSGDISSLPLLLFQVTYFKCGAICIGSLIHHTFGDAGSIVCFVEAWSRTARGLPVKLTPFFDRTILRAQDPPSPVFPHTEYHPPPCHNPPVTSLVYRANPDSDSGVVSLKLTRHQLGALRAKAEIADHKLISTYELLVAHVWRCACFANEDLREEHLTRLHIILDGRSRLRPKLPQGYVGNALFHARPISLLGDLLRERFSTTVERVHGEIRKMDNEYLRSAIDFLERHPDLDQLVPGEENPIFSCAANFCIVSLPKDTAYELDFGWGKPFFKRTSHLNEGKGLVGMSLDEEGSFMVFMCLKKTQLGKFRKLFYEFLSVSSL
ncbi:unnamed protein product [Eruca vesicaria subsp. sativa]|uniref:Uncharacterized protein n=1 Tax=Eruca vesicaria subsp. sativa TaxID=29727 RepID=A0ABC8LRB1_ERUVS|nr:unnamed protein product [Eruca vesicaria subsp. sativa]